MKFFLSFRILLPIPLVMFVMAFLWLKYQCFIITPLKIDKDGYNYSVQAGATSSQVSKELSLLKLTNYHNIYLDIYGRIEGRSHLIKTGDYHVKYGTTLPQLLDQIISGQVIQHAITIIEGMTIQQVMMAIATHPYITQTLVNDDIAAIMASLGKPKSHAEGWFHPETYYFPRGTADIKLLKRAHRRMITRWMLHGRTKRTIYPTITLMKP